jgi:hypothetical protein
MPAQRSARIKYPDQDRDPHRHHDHWNIAATRFPQTQDQSQSQNQRLAIGCSSVPAACGSMDLVEGVGVGVMGKFRRGSKRGVVSQDSRGRASTWTFGLSASA